MSEGRGSAHLLVLTLVVVVLATAGIGQTVGAQSLPDGWETTKAPEGRVAAALHTASRAKMEAWKVDVGEDDVEPFQAAFEDRLRAGGFARTGAENVKVGTTAAQLRTYTKSVLDKEFILLVVEVAGPGELWQFTATYRPAETLNPNKQTADLTTWAASILARTGHPGGDRKLSRTARPPPGGRGAVAAARAGALWVLAGPRPRGPCPGHLGLPEGP
jgi:hypothetical protein